jgi:hypothetical protein
MKLELSRLPYLRYDIHDAPGVSARALFQAREGIFGRPADRPRPAQEFKLAD